VKKKKKRHTASRYPIVICTFNSSNPNPVEDNSINPALYPLTGHTTRPY
jgi:hypothetical protein